MAECVDERIMMIAGGFSHQQPHICTTCTTLMHCVGISFKFMDEFQFFSQQPCHGIEPLEDQIQFYENEVDGVEPSDVLIFMSQKGGGNLLGFS